jgi:hypothetical protein
MKFYKKRIIDSNLYLREIINKKITAIYYSRNISFFKNGELHNTKNAAYIRYDEYKQFRLNGIYYSGENKFTKQSWRRFVKLQAFL